MKKLLALILAAVLLGAAVGCNASDIASSSTVSSSIADGTGSTVQIDDNAKQYVVTEHGVVADSFDSAKANTAAINKLINSCKKDSVILFPKGNYYISSEELCIGIYGKKSLALKGEDAVIINTSFDPTVPINDENYHKSMTVGIQASENILIEGLSFDYYRYVQVSGKIVQKDNAKTVIELDSRYLDGSNKPAITGREIASAVAVLDENGAAIGDHYANGKYETWLDGNQYCILGSFGEVGKEAVARFNISTAPLCYAQETEGFAAENIRSFSSPAAAFLMSGEGNKNFSFKGVTVAPPENAEWRWGCNVDGIFLNCMRGEVNITDCTFIGMGDDSLNVHSTAAKAVAVDGDKVTLNYAYNDSAISKIWVQKDDVLKFYKRDFTLAATATVTKVKNNVLTLSITDGTVSQGDFVENTALSPKVNVKNVTVDGGRARAFLIQSDNVTIENCKISNLGLAGIIISPDIEQWYEMGPSENIKISGCTFENVCAMNGDNCKGAIFSAASHGGAATSKIIHRNIEISGNTFKGFNHPAINLTSVDGVTLRDNIYSDGVLSHVTSNCKNVTE